MQIVHIVKFVTVIFIGTIIDMLLYQKLSLWKIRRKSSAKRENHINVYVLGDV